MSPTGRLRLTSADGGRALHQGRGPRRRVPSGRLENLHLRDGKAGGASQAACSHRAARPFPFLVEGLLRSGSRDTISPSAWCSPSRTQGRRGTGPADSGSGERVCVLELMGGTYGGGLPNPPGQTKSRTPPSPPGRLAQLLRVGRTVGRRPASVALRTVDGQGSRALGYRLERSQGREDGCEGHRDSREDRGSGHGLAIGLRTACLEVLPPDLPRRLRHSSSGA